ncbi:alpha/beta hydrolase [Nonomuraea sp. NBC_01738]|uniref:alpha/beta hydrolase n=1 Tax=Nonomuraea sp. NBC_01738 TaxID=2976003 RepID=UPI002E10338A|nr:alpha/beta hydrolase [Nonomuraea sp. NBC_01738]
MAGAVLFASGCGGSPASAPPALAWRDCGDDFECAVLKMPLDHGKPDGEQIQISVNRLPATGERIGSLLVNPGGPGGSGLDYARAAQVIVGPAVRERFDIVGFDPRGVGASTPVKCLSNERLDAFIALDATPDDEAERAAYVRASKEFAQGCEQRSGKLLAHLSTADAARDMDLLRQALGEEKLTYLGKSYGTFLGAVYADLFPGKVRALVLDGALDPAISRMRLNEDQAKGFDAAFRAYTASCFAEPSCPFAGHTAEGALAELAELLRRTDGKPLRGDDGRQVTEAIATLGALTPLYDRNSWPTLTESIRAAMSGDGTQLLRSADQLVGRRSDGSYSNQTEAGMAVNCVDSSYPADASTYADQAVSGAASAPAFGPYVMWSSLPCVFWPAAPAMTAGPLRAAGAPPILVVGTTRDPATPYSWARALAGELESGVLLTYDGDGHTAYAGGSGCVDGVVEGYLVSLRVPEGGKRC